MTKKELLTTDALIKHMKTKGITFNLIDETAAKHFLEEHNYYFKLSAYRNNYLKHQTGDNKGKYIHLDFSYLKELSVIDMHLRYLLLELCLDIEHAIKIALINDAVINPEEDGYKIINKYLQHYTISATTHKGAYCSDLINKHIPFGYFVKYAPLEIYVYCISYIIQNILNDSPLSQLFCLQ